MIGEARGPSRLPAAPEMLDALYRVRVEEVPELGSPEFEPFCLERGWPPMRDGRGAWLPSLHTYLRGARWAVYRDGVLIDVTDSDGLEFLGPPDEVPSRSFLSQDRCREDPTVRRVRRALEDDTERPF